MHPKDLVFIYCKFPHVKQLGYNLKKDILKEISLFLRSTPNKPNIEKAFFYPSSKVNYNNILFFKEIGFELSFSSDNERNCYFMILKNSIDMPPIPIKKQTYFHYVLLDRLRQDLSLKKYYDSLGFFDENLIKIEYTFEPYFTMINKIFLNEKDYIAIEFFEKKHLNKYTGIFAEKLRISNILTFSKEEKCKRFYIFWENNINNEEYINNFINDIVFFIKNYYDSLENFIKDKIKTKIDINKNIFDMFYLQDKEISISELNEMIQWKDEKMKNEFYIMFKLALMELGITSRDLNLENHKEGFLNKKEFNLYIQKLTTIFVKDESIIEYWCNLRSEIQKEIQNCHIEFMDSKLYYQENNVYGLEDFN